MYFSITNFFQKVFWVFDFGHLFLSIFENPKKVLKKGVAKTNCDENDLNSKKSSKYL